MHAIYYAIPPRCVKLVGGGSVDVFAHSAIPLVPALNVLAGARVEKMRQAM
eukprot:gene11266-1286_t